MTKLLNTAKLALFITYISCASLSSVSRLITTSRNFSNLHIFIMFEYGLIYKGLEEKRIWLIK